MQGQDYFSSLLIQPRARAPVVVKDQPLRARFKSVTGPNLQSPTESMQGAISRDSQGRLRMEYRTSRGEKWTIISNPIAGKLTFLNDSAHTATTTDIGTAAVAQTGWAFANCIPSFTSEYKIISGVKCRRVLLADARDRHDAGETWISESLFIVMSDVGTSDGFAWEWYISKIEFTEPTPAMFEIPADYKHIAEP
jgi:hypothetical protein